MSRAKQFLSFWEICLENLPDGEFRRRCITLADAKHLIQQGREKQALLCLSGKDLLAPYHQNERGKYKELYSALQTHSKISISVSDFFSKHETNEKPLYFTTPLHCMQLRKHHRLLVITCAYDMRMSRKTVFGFRLVPSTIRFYLIEVIKINTAGRTSRSNGRI